MRVREYRRNGDEIVMYSFVIASDQRERGNLLMSLSDFNRNERGESENESIGETVSRSNKQNILNEANRLDRLR